MWNFFPLFSVVCPFWGFYTPNFLRCKTNIVLNLWSVQTRVMINVCWKQIAIIYYKVLNMLTSLSWKSLLFTFVYQCYFSIWFENIFLYYYQLNDLTSFEISFPVNVVILFSYFPFLMYKDIFFDLKCLITLNFCTFCFRVTIVIIKKNTL